MHLGLRLPLLALLVLTLAVTLGLAAGNRLPRRSPAIEELVYTARVLPEPLYVGARYATLEIRLRHNRLKSVTADTAKLGAISRQFAADDAGGAHCYLIEIKLSPKLKPGSYPVPIRLTDLSGKTYALKAQVQLKTKPAEPLVISTSRGRQAFAAVLPQPVVAGNRLEPLEDGQRSFDVWLKTIAAAEQQINIQTYFLEGDGLSALLIELLKRKAQCGVEVNLLLCRYSQLGKAPIMPLALKNSGINVIMAGDIGFPREPGSPALLWIRKMHDDYRILSELPREAALLDWTEDRDGTMIDFALHEKMLIVDGRTAIVGGRNISDSYFWWWRDLDLLVEGPLVRQIQANFKQNWLDFKGKPLLAPETRQAYPAFKPGQNARLVCSSPWKDEYYNLEMLCTALNLARDHAYLSSQYLALPPRLSQALTAAAARGVDVRILTNSQETGQEVAHALCHYVSLNYYRELLNSGVRIYEYHGPVTRQRFRPYYHAKQFMVDGCWLAIGSFNLSIRSSYLESELMVAIDDRKLALEREAAFRHELDTAAREVQPADLALKENAFGRRMQLARRIEILY